MNPRAPEPAAGGVSMIGALALVYCLVTPGLAACFYMLAERVRHANEVIAFAYMLGAPIGLMIALVHWFVRRWSPWSSAPIVIVLGALAAAVAGPMALLWGGLAYSLSFPLAHWFGRKVSAPPKP